jgi:hypothetical protein
MGPATTAVKGAVAGAIAAVRRRLPSASSRPDAIELLERDHRRLERLLDQAEKTDARSARRRTELLDTIGADLEMHEQIEEQVFYPALQSHPEGKAIVLEGYEEHHVANVIVAELRALAKDDERWGPKMKVLRENIEHHIEEEEGEMFRTARAVMGQDELRQLGRQMAAMKSDGRRRRKG